MYHFVLQGEHHCMLFRSLCRIAVCQQSKICANEQVEGKVGHGEASLRHTSLFTRGREGGAKKSVTTDFRRFWGPVKKIEVAIALQVDF